MMHGQKNIKLRILILNGVTDGIAETEKVRNGVETLTLVMLIWNAWLAGSS